MKVSSSFQTRTSSVINVNGPALLENSSHDKETWSSPVRKPVLVPMGVHGKRSEGWRTLMEVADLACRSTV